MVDIPTFLIAYLITIVIETPILVIGLSRRHSILRRIAAGLWLTACTYPIFAFSLPRILNIRSIEDPVYPYYLWFGEAFVFISECLLFWLVFGRAEPRTRANTFRDSAVIVVANAASLGFGMLLTKMNWWRYLGIG